MEGQVQVERRMANLRAMLWLVIGGMVIVVVGGGILVARWYRQDQSLLKVTGRESGLMSQELSNLSQELEQRQRLVEPGAEILYGRDIGKLEPFER